MTTLILLVVVFFAVWFFSDSFLTALIITAILGAFLDVDPDNIKKTAKDELAKIEQSIEGHSGGGRMGHGPPEGPEYYKPVKQGDAASYNTESISDQLREQEIVTVPNKGEACFGGGDCFKMRLRRHDDGTLYACEIDGMRCYTVSR